MSTTINYGLYLTDDSSVTFYEWWNKMNGTTDSNMIKIDAALGVKANQSASVASTLYATGWEGTASPYTQTLTISGLTADHNGVISLSASATSAEKAAAIDAVLSVAAQADGTLTIQAEGIVPTIDIPVAMVLLG